MQQVSVTKKEYYIVFTKSTHNSWMVKMLKPPFQHVYLIQKSQGGAFWIIVDPKASHTEMNLLPVSEYPHVRLLCESNDVILPVKTIIKPDDRWTFCIINCVEIVKSFLGIRAFWVWTPKQLYNYILKEGVRA
jgi:hypothetical protein